MKTNNAGLRALTTSKERAEIRAVGIRHESVRLKRTFNQKTYNQALECTGVVRFWRVVGPQGHPSLNSDLSVEGLREWRLI